MLFKDAEGNWSREDDEGNSVLLTCEDIKEEWVICYECKGEGMSLCDGMRGHAYSMEEFHEEFDEEERHGYFNGRYDTRCDQCGGSGKIKEINFERMEEDNPSLSEEFKEYFDDQRYEAAVYRAEMGWG